ncbi:hypothetical protein [Motilibacter deserti]|uniref:Uncharacterized protein n=1 Tax=Motilibacter deserti TaxID=2714956 RepID=A0ABX0H3K7_9ACTN|nr:hypothetical protein [Motilibacter deserti]NHC16322.1 hypothetical protein [Motilibacter deserti]
MDRALAALPPTEHAALALLHQVGGWAGADALEFSEDEFTRVAVRAERELAASLAQLHVGLPVTAALASVASSAPAPGPNLASGVRQASRRRVVRAVVGGAAVLAVLAAATATLGRGDPEDAVPAFVATPCPSPAVPSAASRPDAPGGELAESMLLAAADLGPTWSRTDASVGAPVRLGPGVGPVDPGGQRTAWAQVLRSDGDEVRWTVRQSVVRYAPGRAEGAFAAARTALTCGGGTVWQELGAQHSDDAEAFAVARRTANVPSAGTTWGTLVRSGDVLTYVALSALTPTGGAVPSEATLDAIVDVARARLRGEPAASVPALPTRLGQLGIAATTPGGP